MKTKQRIKKAIGQTCPQPMPPAPAAENGPTDKQISENSFHLPPYIDMFRLADPTDSNSIFNIEATMLSKKSMAPNLSGSLTPWIQQVKALVTRGTSAASETNWIKNAFILAHKRQLPVPLLWPPLLSPETWLGAWLLMPHALAEVNAAYPGAIYTEPEFIEKIRGMTFLAAEGDTPDKRNMANGWLRTVLAVPPPPRKQPRKGKTKSKGKSGRLPRSPEIHLSSIHIWAIQQLYMNIVTIRKVHTERNRSADKLLLVLPELSHVKDRKPEWFNKIVQARPSGPLDTACEIIANIPESGLHGYKPESIRKAFERQSQKAKSNLIPTFEKFARAQGKKLVEEFNKKAAKVSSNSTP